MSYAIFAAGYGDWPIIKQIATVLGLLMNGIFNALSAIGIQNIGICIIVFTVIIYTLLIPLTIKQQKWSKMSAVMQPEIKKVQKKYAGKRDQASMMKQQEELQIVYEKYGASPTGGCLPVLIQMPILFALYPVVYNIPKYVSAVRNVYMPVVNQIMASAGFQKIMEEIGSAKPILMSPKTYDYSQADTLVNVLYKFQSANWDTLMDKLPSVSDAAGTTISQIGHMNSFLGINIGEQPINMFMAALKPFNGVGIIMAIIIPIMAGLTQFLSVKLTPQPQMPEGDNPMGNSMKTMTYMMPLMSVFFGFSLPAGMGLYWAASALVRSVQQLAINKYLSKKSVDELIEENQKKAAKKREKKGVSAGEMSKMASLRTKYASQDQEKKKEWNEDPFAKYDKADPFTDKGREEKISKARSYADKAKPGSLTAKANMVRNFNNQQPVHDKKKNSGETKDGQE